MYLHAILTGKMIGPSSLNTSQVLSEFYVEIVLHGTKAHICFQNVSKLPQTSLPTGFQWQTTNGAST